MGLGGAVGKRLAPSAAAAVIALGTLTVLLPGTAAAGIPSAFGGQIACDVVPDTGHRFCGSDEPRSTVRSFDGVPLDVNVAFPARPATGPDGNYPLIMGFEGYTGGKRGYDWMQSWLDEGYAALSFTPRGFRESCGTPEAREAAPVLCAHGYIRLMDVRYEVRDAQFLAGKLVDDGLVAPKKIAATGGSYGGGISLMLATLRDRVMLPDGSLVPWTSPAGTPMELAAATPAVPWSDLGSVLMDNGSTLDYVADNPYGDRVGIRRSGLFDALIGGCLNWYCAPKGFDPDADLRGWYERTNEGEPYDGDEAILDMLEELSAHHSAYGIPADRPPAPVLITAGTTDDVVPVSEAIRFYNRTRTLFPNAPISLFLGDLGHPRAQSPEAVTDYAGGIRRAWIRHFTEGAGATPHTGATMLTQTCPTSATPRAELRAADPATLAPGEIRFTSAAAKTVTPNGGNDQVAQQLHPYTEGAACKRVAGADQAGTASYRLAPAPAEGFTLAGSPTVIADVASPEPNSQLAARLYDVAPDGRATLVTRAVWRPAASETPVRSVFQLQANAWRFEPGHVAKLELLPKESSFWRESNGQGPVTVSNLELRLPVNEPPGSAGGLVSAPAEKVLRPGLELALPYRSQVRVTVSGSGAGTVTSTPSGISCPSVCNALFVPGTQLTLTAQAAPGSAFTGWSGGGCSGTGTCTVVASSTAAVEARFMARHQLTLVVNGAGTISSPTHGFSCTRNCEYTVTEGETVRLVATPAPGHQLVDWDGRCDGVSGPVCDVPIDRARSAIATFLPVDQGDPGGGNPGGGDPGGGDPGGGNPGGGSGGGGNGGGGSGGGGKDKLPGVVKGTGGGVNTNIRGIARKAKQRTVPARFGSPQPKKKVKAFVCRLDDGPYERCTSPWVYKRVEPGKHKFWVAAVDMDGLMDKTPATRSFKMPK